MKNREETALSIKETTKHVKTLMALCQRGAGADGRGAQWSELTLLELNIIKVLGYNTKYKTITHEHILTYHMIE